MSLSAGKHAASSTLAHGLGTDRWMALPLSFHHSADQGGYTMAGISHPPLRRNNMPLDWGMRCARLWMRTVRHFGRRRKRPTALLGQSSGRHRGPTQSSRQPVDVCARGPPPEEPHPSMQWAYLCIAERAGWQGSMDVYDDVYRYVAPELQTTFFIFVPSLLPQAAMGVVHCAPRVYKLKPDPCFSSFLFFHCKAVMLSRAPVTAHCSCWTAYHREERISGAALTA